MSRTIRRKNGWNKKYYIDNHIFEVELRDFSWSCGHKQGHDLEEVKKQISAKYHTDNYYDRFYAAGIKMYSSWYLRNRHKIETNNALKTGTEDSLLLTSNRHVKKWWWWD